MGLSVTPISGGVRFAVHVQPRAKRPGVDGVHGDALRVRVSAPPVDGAANEMVLDVLAEALGVPVRALALVSGETSRRKTIEAQGVAVSDVLRLVAIA
jgi:uncharacterized protein (TIGR00251 family)